ncbi:MAG: chromate transporter [Syntrophobacteraceae bacterium]
MDASDDEIQVSVSPVPTRWDITRTYFKIGVVGFGGGYAVLDLIHSELVVKHRWLSEQRFENMTALSEMAPGALTVNLLAGIAYRIGGIWTMIAATSALILPSFVLIIALARLFLAWQNNPVVQSAMKGLTAGVVGLLIAVVWDMTKRVPRNWCCFAVGITALFLGLAFPVNPIWLVLLGGFAGAVKVLLTAVFTKKSTAVRSTQ